MKNTFKWMFAAVLICGLTVSSCKKDPEPTPTPEPEPTTQTVLTSIVATGVPFYDSVTYSYEYDAEYRIVRSKAHVTNQDYVIQDVVFTYSDGRISVAGTESEAPVTVECTLDGEGRITHYTKTYVNTDSTTTITNVDYTYDADGRLKSEYTISSGPNGDGGGATSDYVWEGDELKACNMEDGSITIDFVASDAPAQALFHNLDYDVMLSVLCTQGCFGKLPAHMPAKRTMTTSLPIPGMDPIIMTSTYTYTVDADGHLATSMETKESNGDITQHTFNWEER